MSIAVVILNSSLQKHLNEDIIDFDLLEDLICFIDENYPMGAILVFLPVCYLDFRIYYIFSIYNVVFNFYSCISLLVDMITTNRELQKLTC